jgi:ribose-phosphate pyrophosphokinase
VKIFSGSSNKPLAEKIAKSLDAPFSPLEIFVFPDGERRVKVEDKIVDEETAVVQSTNTPADTNYMELFFIVDALKRSGASKVSAVIPYLGYQRQDHIFRDGEAVSLEVIIETLEAVGVNKIITVDLHSVKIPELFKIPILHLSALELFAEEIEKLLALRSTQKFSSSQHDETFSNNSKVRPVSVQSENFVSPRAGDLKSSFVLVSPDMGGIRRIKILSELLNNAQWATIEKNRDLETGIVTADKIEGDSVYGKTAIIVDDMISTGKTINTACKLLEKQGARDIYVFATHAVFSKEAPEILQNSKAKEIFVTDSVFVPEEKYFPKLKILSIDSLIAGSIKD